MDALVSSSGLLSHLKNPFIATILLLVIVVSVGLFALTGRARLPQDAPQQAKGQWPLLGSLDFFSRRRDFFLEEAARSSTGNFSFWVGNQPVVGLTSTGGRKLFFESRELDMGQGYEKLFAGGPSTQPDEVDGGFSKFFISRIVSLLKTPNFQRSHALLVDDTESHIRTLADAASRNAHKTAETDPFSSIYEVVFHLTMRMLGPKEIADDPVLLRKVLDYFEMISDTVSAATVIAPWLPTPGRVLRLYAGFRLYLIINNIISNRQKHNIRHNDSLQFLLDQGDKADNIVAFIVGALFAGQLNSGLNAARVLSYLAVSPKWTAAMRAEVATLLDTHSPETKGQPALQRLRAVPLAAWEAGMPVCDACLRDSIRLQTHGAGFRRNVSGRDLPIPGAGAGEVVPAGAYVALHFQGFHLDQRLYSAPREWDPERYLNEKEKPAEAHTWAGFGAGRHPCLGMRFAKLEQAMIVAFFVEAFDFYAVDAQGKKVDRVPESDLNGHSALKPQEKMFIRYTLREKAL